MRNRNFRVKSASVDEADDQAEAVKSAPKPKPSLLSFDMESDDVKGKAQGRHKAKLRLPDSLLPISVNDAPSTQRSAAGEESE